MLGRVPHAGEALLEGFLEEVALSLDGRGKICKGRMGRGDVSRWGRGSGRGKAWR